MQQGRTTVYRRGKWTFRCLPPVSEIVYAHVLLDYRDLVLQEIKDKLKNLKLKLPKETRRISLITLILLSVDIIVSLSTPFLQTIDFFYGKSEVRMLSDLLFLEGAVIFTVGAFWGFLSRDPRSQSALIIFLVALGASFLGSSVMIGLLFL